MITVEEIRAFAMTLPGVEEGPPVRAARRIAAFKVAGKSFVGIETGGLSLTMSLAVEDALTFLAEQPDAYEEIRRKGTLLGLRVNLSKISVPKMKELIRSSWQHTALNDRARTRARKKQTKH